MAVKYWVSKAGGWSGPTGAGTESSPYMGAIAVRSALGSGAINPGDTVIFMGEYGPVLLAELNADWPIGSAYTISSAINTAAAYPAPTDTVNFRGGILFGTHSNTTSNANEVEFNFRGDGWHIDARGGNAASKRMVAGITVQCYKPNITGLRVAAPDWDYTITGGRVAPSGLYAENVSHENIGLQLWGSVGGVLNDVVCWGSNAFSPYACYVGYSTTVGQTASGDDTLTEIKNSEFYGAASNLEVIAAGVLVPTGTVPDRLRFGRRAIIDVHHCRSHTARWGDNLATPAVNNALYHGGHFSLQFLGAYGSTLRVRDNESWGTCQDSMQLIGVGLDAYDNYVHDLNPGKTNIDTFTRYYNNAGTWGTTSNAYIGDGIKLGLSGYDNTVTALNWPALGATGVGYGDSLRNAAYRNRVHRATGYGITMNGSGGGLLVANECFGGYRGCNLGAIAGGLQQQQYLVNNYFRGSDSGLVVASRNTAFLHNNILRGDGAGADINSNSTSGVVLYGDRNILHNGTTNLGTATNNLTNTLSANAAYIEQFGPVPGGNCDGTGNGHGLPGAWSPTRTRRDVARRIFDMGRVPIGPRSAQAE